MPWLRRSLPLSAQPGHIFTIEPMVNMGTWRDTHWVDGWTAVTKDGLPSAQFEHTLLVNDTGVEILLRLFKAPLALEACRAFKHTRVLCHKPLY